MKSLIGIAVVLGLAPWVAAAKAYHPMETPGPELRPRQTTSPDSTSDALAPWISIDTANSLTTTITPVVTTDSAGVTTTLNAQPTNEPLTNVTDGIRTEMCSPALYDQKGPFCQPSNGSVLYVNQKYLITWYGKFWQQDLNQGSVRIYINYVDTLQKNENRLVWDSQNIDTFDGVKSITVDPKWMNKQANRTVQFSIQRIVPSGESEGDFEQGPIVILTTGAQPKPPYKRPPRSTIAVAVVLPCAAVLIVLLIWAVFHFGRGDRAFDSKGLRAKLGRKKFRKGGGRYGEGKSRAQRMGNTPLSPTSEGDDDWELTNMSGGRDGGNTTATGGASGAPRERTKGSQTNPFSDNYAG